MKEDADYANSQNGTVLIKFLFAVFVFFALGAWIQNSVKPEYGPQPPRCEELMKMFPEIKGNCPTLQRHWESTQVKE